MERVAEARAEKGTGKKSKKGNTVNEDQAAFCEELVVTALFESLPVSLLSPSWDKKPMAKRDTPGRSSSTSISETATTVVESPKSGDGDRPSQHQETLNFVLPNENAADTDLLEIVSHFETEPTLYEAAYLKAHTEVIKLRSALRNLNKLRSEDATQYGKTVAQMDLEATDLRQGIRDAMKAASDKDDIIQELEAQLQQSQENAAEREEAAAKHAAGLRQKCQRLEEMVKKLQNQVAAQQKSVPVVPFSAQDENNQEGLSATPSTLTQRGACFETILDTFEQLSKLQSDSEKIPLRLCITTGEVNAEKKN